MNTVDRVTGIGMVIRLSLLAGVMSVCAVVAPRSTTTETNDTVFDPSAQITDGVLPTPSQFAELARTDPVAMMEACLRRYKQEVKSFRVTLQKQERVGDTLHPPEVVRVSLHEHPFAVQMVWQSGIRDSVAATVYAAGENHGLITLWRPTSFIKKLPMNPKDGLARTASRYSITDSSFQHSMYRSYEKWKAAKAAGTLSWKYEGERVVPECGNRKCHVLTRVYDPYEVDNFSLDEREKKDPNKYPQQAIASIVLYYDCETWIQVGAILKRADGQLIGSYLFKDVELNPTFTPGIFSPEGLTK